MSDFTLGSMYWINPKYSPDDFRREMQTIKDNRITMLRINILWEYIEVERDKFDFSFYDTFFRAAEEAGIGIMATFIHYLPIHYLLEQQENGTGDFQRRYPCLDRPEIRQWTEKYFTECVLRYKDSPALKIWNLCNEPSDYLCSCPHSLEKFTLWLKRKYPTLEDLQEAWAGEYGIFKPLIPGSLDEIDGNWLRKHMALPLKGKDAPMRLDWREFQTANAAEHMAFLASLVRKYDTVHDLHTNPSMTVYNPQYSCISPWEMAKPLNSFSGSIHPHGMLKPLEKDPERYPFALLSVIDLIRSWGDGKETWIGEYQAGSTFHKANAYTPRGTDISAMLYHSLARGMKGLIFWEWQSWRAGLFEPGEFSLRNPSDGGPTERSESVKKFGEFLEKHKNYLAELTPIEPQVAIFHSMDEFAMEELLLSTFRTVPYLQHYNAAYAAHQTLAKAGISADFVTESQFDSGVLSKYKVLILPHVRIITPETAEVIREFVRNGGAVWADGRCGVFDKHLFLRDTVPCNKLDELFGCREIDEVAPRESDQLILKDGSTLKPCREVQRFKVYESAEVLAECNGYPAAVRNHYGTGVAELWGTYLTVNPEADLSELIPAFAVSNNVTVPVSIEVGDDIIVSAVRRNDILFAVFTSLSDETQQVIAHFSGKPIAVLNDIPVTLKDDILKFSIAPMETMAVFVKNIPDSDN